MQEVVFQVEEGQVIVIEKESQAVQVPEPLSCWKTLMQMLIQIQIGQLLENWQPPHQGEGDE